MSYRFQSPVPLAQTGTVKSGTLSPTCNGREKTIVNKDSDVIDGICYLDKNNNLIVNKDSDVKKILIKVILFTLSA